MSRWVLVVGIVLFLSGVTALVTKSSFTPVFVATTGGLVTNLLATYLERDPAGHSNQPLWRRPAVWLTVGCAVALGVTFLRTPPAEKSPDISIQMVDYKLNAQMDLDLLPVGKNLDSLIESTEGDAQVNVRFAIENHESQPLQGVSVELSYPADVDVQSEGTEKVDPSQEDHVYEHTIGTVEPGDPYYAMATADKLDIPLHFYHQEFCYLDETLMPTCEVLVWDTSQGDYSLECNPLSGVMVCVSYSKGHPKPVTRSVHFRIFTDGRPTISGDLRITFGSSSAQVSGDAGPKVVQIRESDPDWDATEVSKDFRPAQGEVLDSWSTVLGHKHPVAMRYRKVRLSAGEIHQELYVGGVLRKVLIGRNNWVGQEIEDTDGVGGPDVDKLFAKFEMLSWRETDFKKAYASTADVPPTEPAQTP